MRAGLVLSMLAGCGFSTPGAGGPGGTDGGVDGANGRDSTPGPGRRKPVVISGSQVTGPLVDFPMWFEVVGDADLTGSTQLDGTDIYFTDAAGVPLAWERRTWDRATGHLAAWVRTSLTAASDTRIYLAFGDPETIHPPVPATVFSAGFAAVWHLDEVSTNGDLADTLAQVPAASNLSGGNVVTGKLGKGVDFNGTTNQATFANPLSGPRAASSHTISAWVTQRATNDDDTLIVLGNSGTDEARWLHTAYQGQRLLATGFYGDDAVSSTDLRMKGWRLLHWVYDAAGKTANVYVDGNVVSARTVNATLATGTAGFLGNIPNANNFGSNMGLHASVDEVRIATVPRTDAWIAAEVANQSSPMTFYTVGAAEPLP